MNPNPKNKYVLDDILNGMHPTYSTNKLKVRLLKEGLKQNRCEECGIKNEWNNRPLVLHLDHINGISNDHALSNLRMLCPNCHSQTETYVGKNKTKERRVSVRGKLNERKRVAAAQRLSTIREKKHCEIEIKKELILSSGIDFLKLGWKTKVAKILDITPQKVTYWCSKHIPELLEISHKRKSPEK
jgi:Zn finger protein HypA/HybF involved in hydrogenase expression